MLVKHLRKDFYETLYGKRLLILSAVDLDAVCTVKILTELLRIDSISFSLVVVQGYNDLRKAFHDYKRAVDVVLLVSCGASVDILDLFDKPKNMVFFVLDAHRPIHIANYYDETQQVRLMTLDDQIDIPAFDDLFRSDLAELEAEDDGEEVEEEEEEIPEEDLLYSEDEDDPGGGELRAKRARMTRRQRRQDYRQWIERRNELVFQYTQFSYYAAPSALVALELSWSMSRADLQYVWWACVSLTEAMTLQKCSRQQYIDKVVNLSMHLTQLTHAQKTPLDCLKVYHRRELMFFLYRHWNVYDSIRMTPLSATVLKSWTLKGESRLHEMIGEIGLPLKECKQKFLAMERRYRRKVEEGFHEAVIESKYKFESVHLDSFVAEIGYRPKINALDAHLAVMALLENPCKQNSLMDNFLDAMKCLSKNQYETMDKGLALAVKQVRAAYDQVQELLNMNAINPRGGFLLATVPQGAPNLDFFQRGGFLLYLAQFAQRAIVAMGRSKRWPSWPLVICIPYDAHWFTLLGIPPLNYQISKNLFGKLFETLGEKVGETVQLDPFDANVVRVREEDKDRFINMLEAFLL